MNTLDSGTWIPLGIAIIAAVAIGSGAWKIANVLSNIDYRLKGIDDKLNVTIQKQDFERWLRILERRNPNLSVPDLPPTEYGKEMET